MHRIQIPYQGQGHVQCQGHDVAGFQCAILWNLVVHTMRLILREKRGCSDVYKRCHGGTLVVTYEVKVMTVVIERVTYGILLSILSLICYLPGL